MMNGKKKATNEEKRIEYTVRNENFSPDGHSTQKKVGNSYTVLFKLTNMTISFFIAMNAQILLNEKLIFKINT